MNCLCYDLQFYVVMEHATIDCDCVQVEFNKASQSLTDAVSKISGFFFFFLPS